MINVIRSATMLIALFAVIHGNSAEAADDGLLNKSARRTKRSLGGDKFAASLRIRPLVTAATGSDRLLQRPAKGVWQRACPKCKIPNYDYNSDHRTATQHVVLNLVVTRPLNADNQHSTLANGEKRFHMEEKALTLEHLQLDRVGLSIDDLGHCFFTGQITHKGSEDLRGSKVTVRLRAYSAQPEDREQLVDAPVVWESEAYSAWVRRGEPHRVTFAPAGNIGMIKLKRHYSEITHVEVELRYHEGRTTSLRFPAVAQ